MGGEDISKAIHGVNINYVGEQGFPYCEQGFPAALEAPPVIDGVVPIVGNPKAAHIKKALDEFMPKSQVLIARKAA